MERANKRSNSRKSSQRQPTKPPITRSEPKIQQVKHFPSIVPAEKGYGISGKFTDHLIYSGMPRNGSLNTTAERDRWVNGSRDWMEKLG